MASRPNIVQITTHDSGRWFGCYNHPTLPTPAIDALAGDGVLLSSYFATVPICCASRATQLTGLYPQTHGLLDLCFPPFSWRLRDEVRPLSRLLGDAGYRTHLFGVQHIVTPDEVDRLGFGDRRAERGQAGGRATAAEVAAALADYLRAEAAHDQPFYLHVGFQETHTPFDFGGAEPDTSLGLEIPAHVADTALSRAAMAGYQGAVRQVDRAVAVILEALRDSGLEDDTLVVFTTDHGLEVPRAKWHLTDPGVGIAMILRYPAGGLSGGRVCDLLLGNVDYAPTILALAGVEVPEAMQGRSFADALAADRPEPVREAVFGLYHKSHSRSVRTLTHKLIRHFDSPTEHRWLPATYEHLLQRRSGRRVELYDLEADPLEFHNLAGQPPVTDVEARLDDLLWRWLEEVDDPVLHGPVRSPSYEAAVADYQDWRKS